MVFSSPVFLFLFLPITLLTAYLVRRRFRNLVLLSASLIFYAWGEAEIVLIMLLSIVGNYIFGLLISRAATQTRAKWWIGLAVFLNIALLSLFKYANFLVDNLNWVMTWLHGPVLSLQPIHLPIGISFFTFQAISYIIDVYRRDTEASRNPINFALYIASFPQLIAGPIVRYRDIAQQLLFRTTTMDKFASGSIRFILGLGKKVLIASVMAKIADPIFSLPADQLTTQLAWLALVAFAFQVYFDFSAYSDMAIGLGRMFGFEFMENFDYPYICQSIREFWRRWHISLSTWFRDYLYIAMGGNRRGPFRTYFNLFTIFFLCGLWHGANWTFIMLGVIHGVFMVLERLGLEKLLMKTWRPFRHFYALLVLLVSFVFFRAPDMATAMNFLKHMFGLVPNLPSFPVLYYVTGENIFFGILALLGSFPLFPWLKKKWETFFATGSGFSPLLQMAGQAGGLVFLLTVLLLSAMSMASGTYDAFIYFRF